MKVRERKMETDKIYLMDCLEGMRQMPDKCVDLVITDPPYELKQHAGSSAGAFGRNKRQYHQSIDHLQTGVSDEVLKECLRVLRVPNMYVFCSKDQLPQLLTFAVENNLSYDLLTWHKTNPVPMCNNKYLSDTEYIVFMRKGAPLYGEYETKRKWFLLPTNKADKKRFHHPTPKPLEIIQTLVTNSSREGDVVLDPYMGSGTTAVACIRGRRKYIGFEINGEYLEQAEKRIEWERRQGSLFG